MASTSTALKAAATGKAVEPSKDLVTFLEKHKAQIQAALPKHLTPDRMIRLTLTAFNQNKALRECDMRTIFASVVIASQLGLEIGVSGQGYLVPFKGKATFIPGWQGLVDLVSRAGRSTVWTGAVYEGDEFDYALGDKPFIRHKPAGEDDPAKLTHTYAVGRVNGSDWPVLEIWPIRRIKTHRDKNNRVGTDHYSFKHWEMYARKVPLLQVLKYMPKSIELTNALAVESAYEQGKTAAIDGSFVVVPDDQPADDAPPAAGGAGGDMPPPQGTPDITKERVAALIAKAENAEEVSMALDLARGRDSPISKEDLLYLTEAARKAKARFQPAQD